MTAIDPKALRALAERTLLCFAEGADIDVPNLARCVLALLDEHDAVAAALVGYGGTATPPANLAHCAAVAVSSHQHVTSLYDASRQEVSDLRHAVIHVASLGDSRRDTMREIWAIRTVANIISVPFSLERADAKLREFRAEDVTIEEVQRLRDEVARLTACLAEANENHEAARAAFNRGIAAINGVLKAAGVDPVPGVGGKSTIDCVRELVAARDACAWPQPCTGCGVLVGDAQCGACAHGPTEQRLKTDLERVSAEREQLRVDLALAKGRTP